MKLILLILLLSASAHAGKRLIWDENPDGTRAKGFNVYYDDNIPATDALTKGPIDAGKNLSTKNPGKYELELLLDGTTFVNGEKYCFEIESYFQDVDGVLHKSSHSGRECGVLVESPLEPVNVQLVE